MSNENPLLDSVDPVNLNLSYLKDAEIDLQFQTFPSKASPQQQDPSKHISIEVPQTQPDPLQDTKSYPFWTLNFYKTFFNIETSDLIARILAVLIPKSYLFDIIRDLYGPIWIANTFILLVFVTGAIRNVFYMKQNGGFQFPFEIIGYSASIVYGFITIIPLICFLCIKYLVLPSNSAINQSNAQGGTVYHQIKFVEVVDSFGYTLSIWCICLVLSVYSVGWFKWIVGLVGLGWTFMVFIRNYYPLFATTIETSSKAKQLSTGTIVLLGILACWLGFFCCFVFYFTNSSVTK